MNVCKTSHTQQQYMWTDKTTWKQLCIHMPKNDGNSRTDVRAINKLEMLKMFRPIPSPWCTIKDT